jgi:enoyl-CoA hydratase
MNDIVLIERRGRVVIATLNRPDALNALNQALMCRLVSELTALDTDPETGCFIVTGSAKAFAAGADIKEIADKDFSEAYAADIFAGWADFAQLRTPVIAAVSGFALGGGCELALMCDFIIAAESAKFGQPEIKLGVIPGMGGSQRLTLAIGKSKASDLILTGRMIGADEAERCGLVSRVVPSEKLMEEALAAAEAIAAHGKLAVMAAKEAIGRAFEGPLSEGLRFERRLIHALFSTKDKSEGMRAFLEKRPPRFMGT